MSLRRPRWLKLPAFARAPRRPGWGRLAALAALGAVFAAGQAPLGAWYLALPALGAIFALGARRAPGWSGFAAGFGFGLAALFWIVEPFQVEAEVYGWMAPFALVAMAAGMGAFWAAGFGAGARLAGVKAPLWLTALGLGLGLAASDALRSYLFTGFPWALAGHIWIATPVAQAAATIGPLGLGLVTVLSAALPAGARRARAAGLAALVAALGLGALWGAGALRLAAPEPERAAPVQIRLVQPNAPQDEKWLPEFRLDFFYRALDLTAQDAAPGAPAPDLIVWPETSAPFLLDRPGDGLSMVAEAAAGTPVALGIQREEGLRYFNSLAMIGPGGTVDALYDKAHLVPFGEYVPFGDLAARFGISAFAAQEGNGYSAGPGPRLLDLGPLGHPLPLICYEAVFPQDILAAPARPDWLLQITNDAWFGTLAGPWQHFALSRLRAIEFGLPLARAANTGISAMIDAKGRVTASLELGRAGVVDAALPAALPATLYVRSGDFPVLTLLAAISALIYLFGRKYRVDLTPPQV